MRKIDIDVIRKILSESSKETEVYIGCDSQRYKKNGQWYARYARCVVIHKDGKHGCSVFGDVVSEPDYGQLRVRLLNEVQKVVDLGVELVDHLDGRAMHVHLDINSDPNHKSHVVMKEAIGWVRGMLQIEPEVKPNAWAATHCADNFCH